MAPDCPQEPPKVNKLEEILKEFKEIYDGEVREYRRCLNIVAQDLRHVLAQEAIRHLPITARVKAWGSISGTAQRRQKDRLAAQTIRDKMVEQKENREQHFDRYKMSKTDLGYFGSLGEIERVFHDILGARIALYFPNDTRKTLDLLRDAGYESAKKPKRMGGLADAERLRKLYAKWLAASASDAAPADDLDPDGLEKQFSGYGAIHLSVKVPERLRPRDLGPHAEAIWTKRVVEIQVGTVIMHTWSEVEHDITYKTQGREVPENEQAMLDMLNGLALASEVGMRRFRSSPVSPSPVAEEEELRSWLHQLYIANRRSIPNEWVGIDRLWNFLVQGHTNRRDAFLSLAKAAWPTLQKAERTAGLELDHLFPHILMYKGIPTDLIETACRRVGLLQAAYDGQEAVVKLLLEKGVNREPKDRDGDTPLSLAAIRGHEAVVRLLLEKGVNRETKNSYGATPLLWAAMKGHEAVVRLLLEKGSSWEAEDDYGSTALSWAARQGHEAIVRLLRGKGAAECTSIGDDPGLTPLPWITKSERGSDAGLLLDKGKRIEPASANSVRPPPPSLPTTAEGGSLLESSGSLRLSTEEGRQAVVRLLVDKGVRTKLVEKNKNQQAASPPPTASSNDGEAALRLSLYCKGSGANADGSAGGSSEGLRQTPLLWAADRGHEAAVKLLLDGGAKPELTNDEGKTPLSLAAANGRGAVVRLLLERGANTESADDEGQTPLSLAVRKGHETVVRALLDGGAGTESADRSGKTPLLFAAEEGYKAIAQLLLDRGAEIEATDEDGWTPLLRATANGRGAVMQLLVSRGANTELAEAIRGTTCYCYPYDGGGGLVRVRVTQPSWTLRHVGSGWNAGVPGHSWGSPVLDNGQPLTDNKGPSDVPEPYAKWIVIRAHGAISCAQTSAGMEVTELCSRCAADVKV